MITFKPKRVITAAGTLSVLFSLMIAGTAAAVPSAASANSNASAAATATQQQHLANIQSRGAAEINRRLTSLNNVATRINSMAHLTSSDKTTLTDEVNSEISNLTTLKSKLAADTTVAEASADAQSIISDYRVYALVLPKIWLVKTADDQQTTEVKLTTLAQDLQTRINTAKSNGTDVTTMQNELNDMMTQITNAQNISTGVVEQAVINLQPSDYDSNHAVLSGDASQLQTAHKDNQAALADAQSIIATLET